MRRPSWGIILAQLVGSGGMLTNYDAGAVAEVLGIGFQDEPASRTAPPAGSANVRGKSGTVIGPQGKGCVIDVDHVAVRVVDVRAAHSKASGSSGTRKQFGLRPVAMRRASPVLIEKAVELGLPRAALRHVAEQIAGADTARIAALEWGIVPRTTLERREGRLSPPESERTERVARLFVHARRALGSDAEARVFMTAPHPELDGRTPIDAAKTDLGARRTEQVLNALEFGLAV